MATTLQGGSGDGLNNFPLVPGNYLTVGSTTTTQNSNTNRLALAAGERFHFPAGQFQVTPGPYTMIQTRDPITGIWVDFPTAINSPTYISSDGGNWRLSNLTGCAIGAVVTNVGSAYTSTPIVTPSAGSSVWEAIVGGAINTTVTVTAGGTLYTYPPILIVAPPPAGGVAATATAAISAGAISTVTVVDQGAGYQSAPTILVVNDPRDTTGSGAVLTTTLTGSGMVTAIVCTNQGTPLTAVPTLTISGGGGSSATATAVMCFTTTGIGSVTAGSGYGNAAAFGVKSWGGIVNVTAGAVVNPSISSQLLTPRQADWLGLSSAGGAVQATGAVVVDGGLFSAVPSTVVFGAGTGGAAPLNVGGVTDTFIIQSIG